MKVTQMSVPGDPALAVDLHDRLTVVAGLGPGGPDRLAGLFAAALLGGEGVEGTVEVGGEHRPLTPATVAALGLPAGLDVVVRAGDLPGARPGPASPDRADAVSRALGDVHVMEALRAEPDPEAAELADRWAAAARAEPPAPAEDPAEEEARAALARAEEELRQAEAGAGAGRPAFDPADARALEAAHAALLAAQERADRRFAGPRAKTAVAEARAAEDAVLGRMGLHSYTEYVMRTSLVGAGGDGGRRVAAARRAVEEARAALAAVQAPAADVAADDGGQERDALREKAAALLGRDPGDDVEAALRACTVGDRGMPAAVDALRRALDAVGVDAGDDPVSVAERWLATAGDEGSGGTDLSAAEPRQVEVYLLARLAALRHAGSAGSVPLVVADALAGAPEAVRERAHGVLLRFSDVVQVVYLSDDPAVAAWAEELGPERAGVYRVEAPAAA